MNDIVIKAENVSKKFCKSLKHVMLYGVQDIARNTLGMSSQSERLREGEFWAVDDVSFEVKRGETLGIIGANGSGKSTILKAINGIFMPDKGRIEINGKVGALIEVGAGFHPMLNGRENIYVNGAILGMSKKEIDRKFDEIVDFADIGDFIDVPVKHYSSGMVVRLGFSIAAHCEPDILLVDEVLSVGDLSFAFKAQKKIAEYMIKGGTTIFVSHNLQAVKNICSKVTWLSYGTIQDYGNALEVASAYEDNVMLNQKTREKGLRINNDPDVKITEVEFLNKDNRKCEIFQNGDYLKLRIHFDCKRLVHNPILAVCIFNLQDQVMSLNCSHFDGYKFSSLSGKGYVDFCINKLIFNPSRYICTITLSADNIANTLDKHIKSYSFTILGGSKAHGLVNPFPEWQLNRLTP